MKNNKHTTALLDVITDSNFEHDYMFLVMDYVDSDLKKVFNSSKKIEFNEEHVLIILYNTLCSMNFIHSAGIMHRDIKPANILIDSECQVKICDFGFSRTIPSTLIIPNRDNSSSNQRIITSPKNVKKLPSLGLGQVSPLIQSTDASKWENRRQFKTPKANNKKIVFTAQ